MCSTIIEKPSIAILKRGAKGPFSDIAGADEFHAAQVPFLVAALPVLDVTERFDVFRTLNGRLLSFEPRECLFRIPDPR